MKSPRHRVTLIAFCMIAICSARASEDDKLQAFFKDYLEQVFQQRPLAATALGDHRFDAKLDDISPDARAGWQALDVGPHDEGPHP